MEKLKDPKLVILLLTIAFLALIPFLGTSSYLLSTLISIFMYCTLCVSWNIIGGYTGYLSFGHAAFFGLGAYTCALLNRYYGLPIYTVIFGGFVAMVVAAVVGYPCLKLRGPYFAVITFATTPLFSSLFSNLEFAGRAEGVFLKSPYSSGDIYLIALGTLIAAVIMAEIIERSKFGMGLKSIHDDEEAAEVMGIDTARMKMKAFILSAFFPAVIGGVYAFHKLYVNPVTVFDTKMTILIVLFSLLGGTKRWIGPLLGASIFVILDRLLRVYSEPLIDMFRLKLVFPYISSGILTLIIYGILFVLVTTSMRGGILGWISERKESMKKLAHKFWFGENKGGLHAPRS